MTKLELPDAIDVSRVHRSAAYRAVVDGWDQAVLVGCSGGTDSAALLVLASIARAKGRVGPLVAVHVDHCLRPAGEREARFVAGLAAALGVPFVSTSVRTIGDSGAGGPEASLRARRYDAFARLGKRLGAGAVVVAHTFDDQVETVLLRLFSGAPTLAALGMHAERELETACGPLTVLRPLLEIRRSELSALLESTGIPHFEDPSNTDLRFRRNRVRQCLIPEIEQLDPGFGHGLLRALRHASRDSALVEELARGAMQAVATDAPGSVRVDREFIRAEHPALTTRVILWSAIKLVKGDAREVTWERIEAVRRAASGRTGATIELPYGLVALVERDAIVIAHRQEWTGQ